VNRFSGASLRADARPILESKFTVAASGAKKGEIGSKGCPTALLLFTLIV
jgi:hypothetical protein